MPKVNIKLQSSKAVQDVYSKVCQMLESDKDLQKLDPGYKCTWAPEKLWGEAKGKQFTAQLKVSEVQGKANIEVQVDLPFHLALVKGVVEKTLTKKLEAAIS